MTKDMILKKMFNAFGKGWSKDSVEFIADELRDEPVDSFNKAAGYFMTSTNSIPAPVVFARKVRSLTAEDRERYTTHNKMQYQQANEEVKDNPEQAADTLAILKRVGLLTRKQFISQVSRLEDKYPGVGYLESAREYHTYLVDRNENLDSRPPNFLLFSSYE
jgi:hypothetical protein